MTNKKLMTTKVDAKLAKEFKSICAEDEHTIAEVLEEYMKEIIAQPPETEKIEIDLNSDQVKRIKLTRPFTHIGYNEYGLGSKK